jgi:hypothetical protein
MKFARNHKLYSTHEAQRAFFSRQHGTKVINKLMLGTTGNTFSPMSKQAGITVSGFFTKIRSLEHTLPKLEGNLIIRNMQDPGGKFYFGSPPVVSDPCQSVL